MSGHALVTGASSGIGAAVAAHLLEAGWTVTALSRREPARHERLTWQQVDLSDLTAVRAAAKSAAPVDAVVHAAGLQRSGFLGKLADADGEAMWRVHVAAAVALVDELAPTLPEGGRVVLIGSRTSTGSPGKSLYAATKAAMESLARSWAAELVTRGVTVNVVAPGPTDTPMLNAPERAATPVAPPPTGRLIAPEEIAATTAFLLGPHARSITGQTLTVCAGKSLPLT